MFSCVILKNREDNPGTVRAVDDRIFEKIDAVMRIVLLLKGLSQNRGET
jgi:hypothetical protein